VRREVNSYVVRGMRRVHGTSDEPSGRRLAVVTRPMSGCRTVLLTALAMLASSRRSWRPGPPPDGVCDKATQSRVGLIAPFATDDPAWQHGRGAPLPATGLTCTLRGRV
jgi:hypothetical protein